MIFSFREHVLEYVGHIFSTPLDTSRPGEEPLRIFQNKFQRLFRFYIMINLFHAVHAVISLVGDEGGDFLPFCSGDNQCLFIHDEYFDRLYL
jgi:hypothetical protein